MMYETKFTIRVITYLVVCLHPVAGLAQSFDPAYDLGEVIISATKTEQYQSQVGSSTTVITASDMERYGSVLAADVLRAAPGVSVRRNSVFGGLTGVDIRGAKSGQTMVMIDGVEVYDPIAIDRDFDFAHLTTDGIERIEIVRGPQSTLYGANAMAGVINIITQKGRGDTRCEYLFEGGSFDTFRESLRLSAGTDEYHYAVGAARIDSAGVSKARGGAEPDGYKSTTVSAHFGRKIMETGELFFISRFTDAEFEIDSYNFLTATVEDDLNRINYSRQLVVKTGIEHRIHDHWTQTLSVSGISMDRRDRDPADGINPTDDDSRFRGDVKKLQWHHAVSLTDRDVQTVGVEYQQERGSSYADTAWPSRFDRRSLDSKGYYYQTHLRLDDRLFLTAGARRDEFDLFGCETTYRAAASYAIDATQTRVRTSYGTGFKAPSLFQLFDGVNGNELLNAEKSRGYDVGVEQHFFDKKFTCGVTYFYTAFDDLITWTPDFPGAWTGQYQNIKKARTAGMEYESAVSLTDDLTLTAQYTHTKTRDRDTGTEFGRRPRHQAAVGLDYAYSAQGTVSFNSRFVGTRFDDDANTRVLKKYYVFDIAARYAVRQELEFFWRIENMFDRGYELISGFDGLGRAVYAGVTGAF